MAWSDFYIIGSGGSDLSGGDASAPSPAVTGVAGTFNTGTPNTFTASSGTPFAGVTTGMWVAVYVGTPTATSYVAQVVAGSTTSVLNLSTTMYIGTTPTNGSSTNCTAGGSWASFKNIVTGVFNTANALGGPTRVNIAYNGGTAYAQTTAAVTSTQSGTLANPLWWRGYNTAAGDCDNNLTLARPIISWTNASYTITGGNNIFSSLRFNFARTGTNSCIVFSTTSWTNFFNVTIDNSAGSSTGSMTSFSVYGYANWTACEFIANTQAAYAAGSSGYGGNAYVGCLLGGNTSGTAVIFAPSSIGVAAVITNCVIMNGVLGITHTGGSLVSTGNTFYNLSSDAIKSTVNGLIGSTIVTNNLFSNISGYCVNPAGTASLFILSGNVTYNVGNLLNTTNMALPAVGAFSNLVDASSPFVSAAGGDLTPVTGSNAQNNAIPNYWRSLLAGSGLTNYRDIGAIQHGQSSPTFPAVGNVWEGAPQFGYIGSLQSGLLQLPAATDLRNKVTCGNPASPVAGTLIVAGAASGAAVLLEDTGTDAYGGSGTCAKLTATSQAATGYWHFYVPVSAGNAFSLGFYQKISSGFNGTLAATVFDTTGSTLLSSSSIVLVNDNAYHATTLPPVTPSGTGFCLVQFEIVLGANTAANYILFDSFSGV